MDRLKHLHDRREELSSERQQLRRDRDARRTDLEASLRRLQDFAEVIFADTPDRLERLGFVVTSDDEPSS